MIKEKIKNIKKLYNESKCDLTENGIVDLDIKKSFALSKERTEELLREDRQPLLMAFDKWEKAVLRGREKDDLKIMTWYYLILDLDITAINNVPERIKYYL